MSNFNKSDVFVMSVNTITDKRVISTTDVVESVDDCNANSICSGASKDATVLSTDSKDSGLCPPDSLGDGLDITGDPDSIGTVGKPSCSLA